MKTYKQFLLESVNISGDFNGNLYMNTPIKQEPVGEEYVADIMWNGSIHRINFLSPNGLPSTKDLGEQLQSDYPGAIVHQIYPFMDKSNYIKSTKRYHPGKLEWIDD